MPTGITHSTEPAAVEIPFEYQFLLMINEAELSREPVVSVIRSQEELQSFYEETQWTYCRSVYDWDSVDISEAYAEYDGKYFEDKYLILLAFSSGSYCFEHEIPKIVYDPSGQMEICIDTIIVGGFDDHPGAWCGIVELDRDYQKEAEDIKVSITEYNYPNGRPADS